MLVKSTPVVDFINILRAPFLVWKQIAKLSLVMFQLCNFWRQNFVQNCVRNMLMKLTPGCFKVTQKRNLCKLRGKPIHGVNFTNIFTRSFYVCSSKKRNSQSSCQCLFTLLGSVNVKAVQRTLMKLSHEVGFILIQLENWKKKPLEKLNKHMEYLSSTSTMEYLKFFLLSEDEIKNLVR